jgi:ferrous iron transport protein B
MSAVAVVGKPNSGKSLLFNRLTGLNQKVTNFPGITVEVKKGHRKDKTFYDFPGFYSFSALTQDEIVSVERFVEALEKKEISKILCVLDSTQLKSSLRMGLEVRKQAAQMNVPLIFAANMIDELEVQDSVDWKAFEKELGAPVVPISAKTSQGFNNLFQALDRDINPPPLEEEEDYYIKAQSLCNRHAPSLQGATSKKRGLDGFFLSPLFGLVSFLVIMSILFQAVFTFAVPFMDFTEAAVSFLANLASSTLPEGAFKDFIVDAFFGGIGSFLVFVPQIFFLTFIIGILEDSGYLARAAMLCHRPLRYFGLSGKSFIPMLTGHACAIPAVYAARMIDSPKKRYLTLLIIPLMGCSARLPVYAFLIAAIIPQTTFLGGLIGLQGLALFFMYLFGILVALIVSWLLSRSRYIKSEDIPFILELPPYRLPHWRPLTSRAFMSVWQFIRRAGGVIFTVTVVVWVLGYFPSGNLSSSYLSYLGQAIEPLIAPLGLDWKYGVAILTSFLAREVFVGTLGTLFEIENAEENFAGLLENVQNAGLGFASGMALLIFYAIALQCASTFAVLKSELGNYKGPTLITVGYGLLAFVSAWFTYFALA